MKEKSIIVAYLLWFLGSFGILGLHRFYLNRNYTGFIWLMSFGLFGAGAYIDFFTLWKKVEEYNLEIRIKRLEIINSLSNKIGYV